MKVKTIVVLLLLFQIPNFSELDRTQNEISFNVRGDSFSKSQKIFEEGLEFFVFSNSIEDYNLLENSIQNYPTLLIKKMRLSIDALGEVINKKYSIFPVTQFEMTNELDNIQIELPMLNSVSDANDMKVSELWNMGYNGTNTVIAVFDDGIYFSHPALEGQDFQNPVLFNSDPYGSYAPCKSHGTRVAGLIAASGNDGNPQYRGNAFGSKLVSVEFGCGPGNILYGDAMGGLEWIAQNHENIDVLNLSWNAGYAFVFEPIIDRLANLGINVVVSAGNAGSSTFTIGDPGTSVSAITVGSVDSNQNVASFSSRGPTIGYTAKPDLVASGVSLTTTSNLGTYTSFTGTSGSAPLVAGAIGTLISALEANNINWNPGAIKAALMKTAVPKSGNIYYEGQGFVDLSSAWNLLQNLELENNTPMIVSLTPDNGPINEFANLPRNVYTEIPLTLVTSHPNSTHLSIDGNLSQILSLSEIEESYSQIIDLKIDTTEVPIGTYTGTITATIGNDSSTSSFEFTVSESAAGSILIDLGHTNWDQNKLDWRYGGNIGEMISLAQSQGYFVTETRKFLDLDYIKKFDVLWLPDPLNIYSDPISAMNPLTNEEIESIVEFVNQGGSLFIDFNGIILQDGIGGTNPEALNPLLSQFNITTYSEPIIPNLDVVISTNKSSLMSGITNLTHFGNYLDISGQTISLSENENGSTLAFKNVGDKGRVLVASSNFWLDNDGVNGAYSSYGGLNDKLLAEKVWNWLCSLNRSIIIDQQLNLNEYSMDFQLQSNLSNIETKIEIRKGNTLVAENIEIYPANITNSYSYEFEEEGEYQFLLETEFDYIRWEYNVKFVIPTPEPSSSDISSKNPSSKNQETVETRLLPVVFSSFAFLIIFVYRKKMRRD